MKIHIISRLHSLISNRFNRHLPLDKRATDIFIVEFPKSGITWLSCLISNTALIESGCKEHATFASVNLYVPDIHQGRKIGDLAYRKPNLRFIKSHSKKCIGYTYVIYLVRKPTSVMKSYYRFLKYHREGFNLSYKEFLDSPSLGIQAWREHVQGWVKDDKRGTRLHLIKYEDLIVDPNNVLNKLSENLGFNWNQSSINEAISRSSLSNMKNQEKLYSEYAPFHDYDFVSGGANDKLDMEGYDDYIQFACKAELNVLGYTRN